ncbi:MAG: hypothetical protein M3463_00930 [Verrucomicrobiota bacterium]|nr:hypothetical protein [Verrucomicrobiota bacterium]
MRWNFPSNIRFGSARARSTILHVALALDLTCRDFITADLRQGALAKAAGLKVALVEIG